MIMMYFWILHSLIDWVQVEDAIIAMKKQLRDYILQDRKLDTNSIGIEPEIECRKVIKAPISRPEIQYTRKPLHPNLRACFFLYTEWALTPES